jgi:hypothetical chaperone protein
MMTLREGIVVHCGIDFGTTNSVAAVARTGGDRATVVAQEPSCILIVNEAAGHRLYVGREAVDRYLHTTAPARFVKSMKSVLPDLSFTTTNVFGRHYGPEHLARPVLSRLKGQAEAAAGHEIPAVTLGRPVRFSVDPRADAEAERRLEQAARLAGFERVEFRREPEAAGWSYASRLDRESRVLVADLGGGTADFSVILLRPGGPHDALATNGVRIGGDDFDSRIMWERVVSSFGWGSTYESWGRYLDVPPHIFRALCDWDRIPFLKESRTRRDLKYMLKGSSDPPAIERLIRLIDGDLAYALFRSVIDAKHRLSEAERAAVVFGDEGIRVSFDLARSEFEAMIAAEVERLRAETLETLRRADLGAGDVDACFLTGGTSLVPAIVRMFRDIFGEGRLRTGDTFTSVAMGLALMAARG